MRLTKKNALRLAVGVLILFFILSLSIFDSGKDNASKSLRTKVDLGSEQELPSDNNDSNSSTTATAKKPDESTELTDFYRLETKDGKKLWEIKGKVATYQDQTKTQKNNNDQPEIKIQDALFISFDNDAPAYEIKAKVAGLVMGLTGLAAVNLRESVKLLMQSKYTLEASEASYVGSTESITMPVPVVISGDGFEVRGKRLDGNLKTQIFTLSGDVNTFIAAKLDQKNKKNP
jgi:LPS export ABC transporter protein LptC